MRSLNPAFSDYARKINWTLLLFLVLVLNVKMLIKIPVLIILLLISRKMLFDKGIFRQKFIWFYLILAGIAILNTLINISSLSLNYFIALSTGIVFWVLCAAAGLINYQFTSTLDTSSLRATIDFFFILNVIVTIIQLLFIMWDAGSINPYTYQGMYQKYFINTGDRLTGISFDVSTTNAIINSFAVIYFLYSGKMRLCLFCMAALLLTASNFINILLILILLLIFIFQSTRLQKSIIIICMAFLVVFMARVSPQNNRYINEAFSKILNQKKEPGDKTLLTQKTDSIPNEDEKKQKIARLFIDSLRIKSIAHDPENKIMITKPVIPIPDIHSEPFQRKRGATPLQKDLFSFAAQKLPGFDSHENTLISTNIPGKIKAFHQTFHYLQNHPFKLFFGAGAGNFSSKLAFRTTGLQVAGGYPLKFIYINEDFSGNHLSLYLAYFSGDTPSHSLLNTPNSVYNQLVSEYGLAGLLAFIIFYISYFFRGIRKNSFGLPLMLMMLAVFAIDYWFEQMSVVILFELLMLLNLKEIKRQNE